MPPQWIDAAMKIEGALPSVPHWSEDEALRMMDAVGIQTAVLSLTTPGAHLGSDAAARQLTRGVNEFGAELVQRRPGRFGLFAGIPLPDVEGAVAEAVYALDELHADGVGLMSNAGGLYLGDASFRPLWQALDDRSAVVVIHPTPTPGLTDLPGAMGWVDWPFDTTRTAVHMVINGVLRDFPSVKVVLAHAGGFVPYQSGRFEALAAITPGQSAQNVHDDLRKFYFDTALSSSPATLAALIEFAGADHVMFGTDWPAAPLHPFVTDFTAGLDAYFDINPGVETQINHLTAKSVFGRVFS